MSGCVEGRCGRELRERGSRVLTPVDPNACWWSCYWNPRFCSHMIEGRQQGSKEHGYFIMSVGCGMPIDNGVCTNGHATEVVAG